MAQYIDKKVTNCPNCGSNDIRDGVCTYCGTIFNEHEEYEDLAYKDNVYYKMFSGCIEITNPPRIKKKVSN